jgi:hypothetical protein
MKMKIMLQSAATLINFAIKNEDEDNVTCLTKLNGMVTARSSIFLKNSASPGPIPSKLALSAHLAVVRAGRGRRIITPAPQLTGDRDLASPAHPPPPPRKAGSGREEVEGDEEAEEERAHGDGATAATWKPMTCGVGGTRRRGLERAPPADLWLGHHHRTGEVWK